MIDIFDLLRDSNNISRATCRSVNQFCSTWNLSGFHGLLETHIYAEPVLADLLSKLLQIDRVYSIFANESGAPLRKKIPYQMARDWECFPSLVSPENGWAEIIIADPSQRQRIAHFRNQFDSKVHFAVGTRSDIRRAIEESYKVPDFLPFLHGSRAAKP